MGKAKRPVSINGIEFDALISEEHTMEATVPEYSVESGYNVSDSIILGEETLSMVLFLTDTPVTWYDRHGSGGDRVESVIQKMKDLYYARQPVTVITTDAKYTDMAIESIGFKKSTEIGYAREIPVSFRKVRITSVKTTTIPSNYGKSGASGANAGTGSTSSGSSGGGGGSKSSSSGSSSSSSSSGSKSSILYSIGKSTGIIK